MSVQFNYIYYMQKLKRFLTRASSAKFFSGSSGILW